MFEKVKAKIRKTKKPKPQLVIDTIDEYEKSRSIDLKEWVVKLVTGTIIAIIALFSLVVFYTILYKPVGDEILLSSVKGFIDVLTNVSNFIGSIF